jgi:hopene-associated glycosyltransferase HpnB
VAIWLYLVSARGGFWRLREIVPRPEGQALPASTVAAIVPARNEADVVGLAIRSLLEQNYPERLHVFLVDDDSSDGTAAAAQRAAEEVDGADRLTVVQARPLPEGWRGKIWALSEGIKRAAESGYDCFLFADADIVHASNNVTSLVAYAERNDLDLVSLMVKLSCKSLPEQAVIPAFVFFFFMLYPPAWVARKDRRTAAAAGGCILIRSVALARMGGIAAIRGELIDDCALARAVKRAGRISLGLTEGTRSLRSYTRWSDVEGMISRSAFAELHHSVLLLAGTIASMTLTFCIPPLLIAMGSWAAALGLTAWLLMSCAFWPTVRFYGGSPLWAPLLPLTAAFYMGTTMHSAIRYWQGHGGTWKGRTQDPSRVRG